ncbi:MAG: phosphomannomutase [Pseudomonadota bacterium]
MAATTDLRQTATPSLGCFKAYDIRGVVPEDLNDRVAYAIGRATAEVLSPRSLVVGHDIRHTSPGLADALSLGLRDAGVDVYDIGLCGTEEIYFATAHFGHGGGIMVTASHNPMEYNGMKLVREGARPVSGDSGLFDIRDRAALLLDTGPRRPKEPPGPAQQLDARPAYLEHLLSYVDRPSLKPLKIAMNAGNGGAGMVASALEDALPFELEKLHFEPDGDFPHGIPNPLLPERRGETVRLVQDCGADFGVAWDGDFDRCFFFDENGEFIEGYYIVGLLAEAFLRKQPGARIVHDPRLTWNTIDVVRAAGGIPVLSKTGHAFIKERMRAEDALYGGEMSAHHYFRDFFYCDSGMIPWLLVAELLSITGKPLSTLVRERMDAYPCSGEINFRVEDIGEAVNRIRSHFTAQAVHEDDTDGLSLEFAAWRFNLRGSNTEPVLRLNVETRADRDLLRHRVQEISSILTG